MKKIALVGLMLIGLATQAQQQTLFTIGNEAVSTQEFKAIYLKNKDIGREIDPKTPREYLDLYINFKLKVKEARDMGMDTLSGFKAEFNNYRGQLAQPYLEDRTLDSMLVVEAYNRLGFEVRASHIMIDVPATALPEDTLAAYNKLMAIRASILKGGDFAASAQKNSSDTYSAQRGGDLGYFTAFNMVYPFETVAYNTPVGEISKPVRSQYGYHIIKVIDKRPSSGTVQVRHIFLISNANTESEKSIANEARIKEIYAKLQAGENFEQLAKQFSDDKNTSENGGLLAPFGINVMMPEFESAAFALKNPGDYSAPFKTNIGWHIVMLVDKMPLASFADSKADIEQKIKRDSRSGLGKEVFVEKLKKEYNLTENPKRLKEIYAVADTNILKGMWDPAKGAKLNKTLFSFAGKNVSQQDFVTYMAKNQPKATANKNPQQEVYGLYTRFVNQTIMDYENSQLESKYPEFKMLVTEYRDGILLFDLTQQKVWGKASVDTVGLDGFYQAHKNNYMWPERVSADIYSCENEKTAKAVAKMAGKGFTPEAIEEKYNKTSTLAVVHETGKYAKGQNKVIDAAKWENNAVNTSQQDGRFIVVKINEVMPPQAKALTECRGMVISDYQKQLEADWLKELKAKYAVVVNEEVFKSLEKELN